MHRMKYFRVSRNLGYFCSALSCARCVAFPSWTQTLSSILRSPKKSKVHKSFWCSQIRCVFLLQTIIWIWQLRDESDEAHEECYAGALSHAGARLPVLFVWETASLLLGPKITLVHLSVSLFFLFVNPSTHHCPFTASAHFVHTKKTYCRQKFF